MSESQQERSELYKKRLRFWLKIEVVVVDVAIHLGLAFLLFQIVSGNWRVLTNWTTWMVIAPLEIFIMITLGAARSAVNKIGKPGQDQQAKAASATEALTSGRATYTKLKADLSARYNRAKHGDL